MPLVMVETWLTECESKDDECYCCEGPQSCIQFSVSPHWHSGGQFTRSFCFSDPALNLESSVRGRPRRSQSAKRH